MNTKELKEKIGEEMRTNYPDLYIGLLEKLLDAHDEHMTEIKRYLSEDIDPRRTHHKKAKKVLNLVNKKGDKNAI